MAASDEPDVLIAGGGSAGLSAALAIAQGAPDLKVEVVDAKTPGSGRRDDRASAIAAAASTSPRASSIARIKPAAV